MNSNQKYQPILDPQVRNEAAGVTALPPRLVGGDVLSSRGFPGGTAFDDCSLWNQRRLAGPRPWMHARTAVAARSMTLLRREARGAADL